MRWKQSDIPVNQRSKGMLKTDCVGVKVGFAIPDWFPPERLDYRTGSRDSNTATDALFGLKDVIELEGPGGAFSGTVIMECPLEQVSNFQKWIHEKRCVLDRFFARYKEWKTEKYYAE